MKQEVCVLFGGKSEEYEVSLSSAYNVLENIFPFLKMLMILAASNKEFYMEKFIYKLFKYLISILHKNLQTN